MRTTPLLSNRVDFSNLYNHFEVGKFPGYTNQKNQHGKRRLTKGCYAPKKGCQPPVCQCLIEG